MQGQVKWFNAEKGIGFIVPDNDQGYDTKDVFVTLAAIVMDGCKTLNDGQRVEFEVVTSSKGPQAQNVKPL